MHRYESWTNRLRTTKMLPFDRHPAPTAYFSALALVRAGTGAFFWVINTASSRDRDWGGIAEVSGSGGGGPKRLERQLPNGCRLAEAHWHAGSDWMQNRIGPCDSLGRPMSHVGWRINQVGSADECIHARH
jgi:hypothetical protein